MAATGGGAHPGLGFVGRLTDMIVVGGANVYAPEVEDGHGGRGACPLGSYASDLTGCDNERCFECHSS